MFRGGGSNSIQVVIEIPEERLLLNDVDPKRPSREIFDSATSLLKIIEPWFFGLEYISEEDGRAHWVYLNEPLDAHPIKKTIPIEVKFKPRFFPADQDTIIQDTTREHFYYQVKEDVIAGKLIASSENATVMAGYATQAKFGPYNCNKHTDGYLRNQMMIPAYMEAQMKWTDMQWERRISHWHKVFSNLYRFQALEGYLRISQNLPCYGASYFTVLSHTEEVYHLGVDCKSISIYEWEQFDSPMEGRTYSWADIKTVTAEGKHFIIEFFERGEHDDDINVEEAYYEYTDANGSGDERRGSGAASTVSAGSTGTFTGSNRGGKRGKSKSKLLGRFSRDKPNRFKCRRETAGDSLDMLDECAGYHALWLYCQQADDETIIALRRETNTERNRIMQKALAQMIVRSDTHSETELRMIAKLQEWLQSEYNTNEQTTVNNILMQVQSRLDQINNIKGDDHYDEVLRRLNEIEKIILGASRGNDFDRDALLIEIRAMIEESRLQIPDAGSITSSHVPGYQGLTVFDLDPESRFVYSVLIEHDPFKSWSENRLCLLAQQAEKFEATNMAYITRAGELGDAVYLVQEGQVEVIGNGKRLATLGPRKMFGVHSCMTKCVRTASVRATDTTVFFSISMAHIEATDDGITTRQAQPLQEHAIRESPTERPLSVLHEESEHDSVVQVAGNNNSDGSKTTSKSGPAVEYRVSQYYQGKLPDKDRDSNGTAVSEQKRYADKSNTTASSNQKEGSVEYKGAINEYGPGFARGSQHRVSVTSNDTSLGPNDSASQIIRCERAPSRQRSQEYSEKPIREVRKSDTSSTTSTTSTTSTSTKGTIKSSTLLGTPVESNVTYRTDNYEPAREYAAPIKFTENTSDVNFMKSESSVAPAAHSQAVPNSFHGATNTPQLYVRHENNSKSRSKTHSSSSTSSSTSSSSTSKTSVKSRGSQQQAKDIPGDRAVLENASPSMESRGLTSAQVYSVQNPERSYLSSASHHILPQKVAYEHSGRKLTTISSALYKIPMLRHVPKHKLQELARYHKTRCTVRANDIIYHRGESAKVMYFIKSGVVHLETGDRKARRLTKTEYFGEEALVSLDNVRLHTATALEDCDLYVISNKGIEDEVGSVMSLPTGVSSYLGPQRSLNRGSQQTSYASGAYHQHVSDLRDITATPKYQSSEETITKRIDGGHATTTRASAEWRAASPHGTTQFVSTDRVVDSRVQEFDYAPVGKDGGNFTNNPHLKEFVKKLDAQGNSGSQFSFPKSSFNPHLEHFSHLNKTTTTKRSIVKMQTSQSDNDIML